MGYLDILRNDAKLAENFDTLFDFRLLDALEERDTAEGRCTFSVPGMAFAVDGAGGEYHLLEDGSIGYWSSEGAAGRLAESIDDLFHLIVFSICWHDYCDSSKYSDAAVVLQKFYDAAHREPVYTCYFHEDDGSITESENLFF